MDLAEATDKIRSRLGSASHINARVKFDFGDGGVIFVDATQSPPEISHDDNDADCTLACTLDVFSAILAGTQDPNIAFMMGRLKVRGSMGLALKLNALLES